MSHVSTCLISEKDNPGLEIFREFLETVFPAGGDEDQVARSERIPVRTVLEQALTADDDVYFVLFMRLLRVMTHRLIDLDRCTALPKKFQKSFTFGDTERGECFGDADFHDK